MPDLNHDQPTDQRKNLDYDVDSPPPGTILMLSKSPPDPTHRVYMIHYSNAHTLRISRADGKHTGLAFILKSTSSATIVSQSAGNWLYLTGSV